MKKIIILFYLFYFISSFAISDTDADGVSDEKDICPRVYARSITGCPTLSPQPVLTSLNLCLSSQLKIGKTIATVRPICDTKTNICPRVSNILGVQSCDPIFPVIFDPDTGIVLVRGSIYIVDYTK